MIMIDDDKVNNCLPPKTRRFFRVCFMLHFGSIVYSFLQSSSWCLESRVKAIYRYFMTTVVTPVLAICSEMKLFFNRY
jgi:hypothetical protein